ncbi:MAG: septation ring formation regulator EzrA [Phycisphaerae bacterium]|nr:septation ring formation regulator EzrA [Phycisphaerae bacterium]
MPGGPWWTSLATVSGALAALVGVPLTMIVFYLRSLREEQRATLSIIRTRLEQVESDLRTVERNVDRIQQAYTTKDEWLRETMLARRQLERLSEVLARMQADMENLRGLTSQFGRATNAIIRLADQLAGRLSID